MGRRGRLDGCGGGVAEFRGNVGVGEDGGGGGLL